MGGQARLAGRTVLVTGASRGIGEAVARACGASGADLALTARSADALEALAADLRRDGRRAEAVPADACDEIAVDAAVATLAARLGRIHGAVLNQGLNRIAAVADMTAPHWREVLDTNLTASFLFARALVRSGPPEAILFVSSVSALPGHRKFPGFAAYAAAKRGLLGLAEVLAVELESRTRVYAVCPRGVDTGMFRQTFPGARPELSLEAVAAAIVDLLDPSTAPPSGTVVEI